ncbi:MAG: hypothetical protein Q7S28_03310 [bacterium]|nr:hypothetical protein [bacterium]
MHHHHPIRLLGISLAAILLLWGSSFMPRLSFGPADDLMLGQVSGIIGVGAAIPPNPYNTLNAELDQKAAAISMREMELAARDVAATDVVRAMAQENAARFYLLAGVLMALIFASFYWDFRLMRKEKKLEEELSHFIPHPQP